MIQFENYENAVARFHIGLNINANPVFSWDFYNDTLIQLRNVKEDHKKISDIAAVAKWESKGWDFKSALCDEVIVLTDVKLNIVFASQNIANMNGYKAEELIGMNPRIFQGEASCQITSNEIREAINNRLPFEKKVLNYKKNGEPYYCLIKGFPIFNRSGELVHFIAFEQAA